MVILKLKQGETFTLNGQYCEDDGITPKSLTGVTLASQIRNNKNSLIAALDVTVTDLTAGTYLITAPSGTLFWPIGTLYMDIKETVGGTVLITETVTIMVQNAMTQL